MIFARQENTRETLEVLWRGKTIHDILEMNVDEACIFFNNQKSIYRILSTLQDVDWDISALGNLLRLFQEEKTVKLATELHKVPRKHTMYVI